jgi:hypothetical protein
VAVVEQEDVHQVQQLAALARLVVRVQVLIHAIGHHALAGAASTGKLHDFSLRKLAAAFQLFEAALFCGNSGLFGRLDDSEILNKDAFAFVVLHDCGELLAVDEEGGEVVEALTD